MTPQTVTNILSRAGKETCMQIASDLGLSEYEVRAVIQGKDPKAVRGRKRYEMSSGAHALYQSWTRTVKPETGRCVYFIPKEGRVCGAKCKGQRCEDHPQTVARTINIGAKTGERLSA